MRVVCPEVPAEICFASADQSLQLWHERLCHQNKTYVKEFLGQRGIEVYENKVSCEGCLYGKQQRGRFHERPSRPIVTGALIHADVCGRMQERSIGGSRYFVCFKDDFSTFRRVFFMESKSEVSNCLKVFLSEAKTAGHTIKEFLSDGGGEFKNSQVCRMLQSCVINIRYSMPYTPEQNGAAERENRTIVEAARSILHHKGLPLKLWAEAVFGTKCFVHVPKQRRQKLDPKSVAGFFVGYCGEKDGYRVWLKKQNKIILSRDVIFENEASYSVIAQNGKSCSVVNEPSVDHGSEIELIRSSDVPDSDVCQEIGEASCDAIDSKESSDEQERNLRDRSILKKPARYDNCVLLAEHAEPDTYKEAIASKESSEWLAAMKEEMDSLEANNTWKLVNIPYDRKAIGSRWVYKIKKNADGTVQRFKARLVAKGYSQKVGMDFNETFSPVVRWDTIRTVLSVAAYKKLKLVQFDVKTASMEISRRIFICISFRVLKMGLDKSANC
ncbi:Retrovirus-related Pol polyprotein from transposon TNT 1-94 [Araneus ventricosus]|uniref:Retrovirus-related Pol polyprotein from transposon TNT 1-94 n=1 Tax=Araneus ventricosus TaxID=182803 RepID=A0A4Y2NQI4_ARAVE|nr:Retrovirus-related Pol polyprotein from transposon TNT 1-94 [Araneus ventricosus]